MEIDRLAALTAMKAWAQFVQDSSAREHLKSFSTLAEFLPYRCKDVGHMYVLHMLLESNQSTKNTRFWHALVTFGCNLTIPDHEFEAVSELVMPAVKAASLTNDLYSYQKEYVAAQKAGKREVPNGVWVLMKEHRISESEAKTLCKNLIKAEVQAFVRIVRTIHERTDLSEDARKYIELMQYSVSGNALWSRQCPRYNQSSEASFNLREDVLQPDTSSKRKRHIPSPLTPPEDSTSDADQTSTHKKRSRTYREGPTLVPVAKEDPSENPQLDLAMFSLDPMDDSLLTTQFSGLTLGNNVSLQDPDQALC